MRLNFVWLGYIHIYVCACVCMCVCICVCVMLEINLQQWTIDISLYNRTHYCTLHNNFEGKTSVSPPTHERHPYLTITGELRMSFTSYLEESDRKISGAYCITSLCCGYIICSWWIDICNLFTHILQEGYTGTGKILNVRKEITCH